MEQYFIGEPVFRRGVLVYIGEKEEFRNKLKKDFGITEEIIDGNGCSLCVENSEGARYSIIWVEKFDSTPDSIATLVHEINHSVTELLEYVGVPVTPENTEIVSYYQGFFVREILEKITKRRKSNRKKKASTK